MKITFQILILISLFFTTPLYSKTEKNKKGQFIGEIKTKWLDDGRDMRLLEDFTYLDYKKRKWVSPKDWKIDGATIPSQGYEKLRPFFYSPKRLSHQPSTTKPKKIPLGPPPSRKLRAKTSHFYLNKLNFY